MKDRIEDIGSLSWPLMHNNVSRNDLDCLIEFLKQDDPILTQSSNVIAFEEEWSKWLGIKHSVYVNSGSSANLISLAVLKEISCSSLKPPSKIKIFSIKHQIFLFPI